MAVVADSEFFSMEQMTRKRKIRSPLIIDVGDITFVINRSIRQCIFDYESSFIGDSEAAQRNVLAEFSLLEIFPYDDEITSSFLLFLPVPLRPWLDLSLHHGIGGTGMNKNRKRNKSLNLGFAKIFE